MGNIKYFKSINCCALVCALFLLNQLSSNPLHAGSITEFDGVYHWKSPNMTVRQSRDMSGPQNAERNAGDGPPLKNYAYNFHFDSFGAPPPYDFIEKLKPSNPDAVEINIKQD